MKKYIVLILLALAICCVCALLLGGVAILPRRGVIPSIEILRPQSGTQITLNARVPVQVRAGVKTGRLRRVQLYADGQLIGNIPSKADSVQMLWNWTAPSLGDHTLMAQAVSDRGKLSAASVHLQVVEVPDRDGDGIPDAQDRCADEVGSLASEGCPSITDTDRDGDGVSDEQDRCPDKYGLAENDGCPVPPDRDGDGVHDGMDRCADTPGPIESEGCASTLPEDRDGDGIIDEVDFCPDESGTLDSSGCPPVVSGDRDGDGISDEMDSCPDLIGDEEHSGCPVITEADRDGDGMPDEIDSCPDEPGLETSGGCPLHLPLPGRVTSPLPICIVFPTLCDVMNIESDLDGDGIIDTEDACPENYGPPANGGCPMISIWHGRQLTAESLLCGRFPELCGLDPGDEVVITIELEENLYTDRDWLAVWCYFSGGEGFWYRLPPENPSLKKRDPQIWYLGDHRSVTISTHERSLLSVRAFCQAMEMPFGDPVPLGQIVRVYGEGDWSEIPMMVWSEGATNRFMVIFTMRCRGCD